MHMLSRLRSRQLLIRTQSLVWVIDSLVFSTLLSTRGTLRLIHPSLLGSECDYYYINIQVKGILNSKGDELPIFVFGLRQPAQHSITHHHGHSQSLQRHYRRVSNSQGWQPDWNLDLRCRDGRFDQPKIHRASFIHPRPSLGQRRGQSHPILKARPKLSLLLSLRHA